MNKEQATNKIAELLEERKGRVIGKNIISAALSLMSNPAEAVEKLFFGVQDEISEEKHKLEQELILDLVCKIDNALDEMKNQLMAIPKGENSILIDGLISVRAENSETVTGVRITANSGQVEFQRGTQISVITQGTKETTGLKIG